MNDAWYASAFWSSFNLEINREYLKIQRIKIFEQLHDMEKHPITIDPIKIAETEGEQIIEIYQGDFHRLHSVVPRGSNPVTALDIFDKKDISSIQTFSREWQEQIGGEVFVP